MKKIRIYDMDGCLVDSRHRYRTMQRDDGKIVIDLNYWCENEPKAYEDSLLPLSEQFKADIESGNTFVVIATARVLNAPDRRFIQDKLGVPHHIISRKPEDSRGGAMLKILGLRKLFGLKQFSNIRDMVMYEDNISYLHDICHAFANRGMTGVYIPSEQGH